MDSTLPIFPKPVNQTAECGLVHMQLHDSQRLQRETIEHGAMTPGAARARCTDPDIHTPAPQTRRWAVILLETSFLLMRDRRCISKLTYSTAIATTRKLNPP